ncbi:MAG: GerMN domain-containing protein [Thermoanaerobaculia bacterium]
MRAEKKSFLIIFVAAVALVVACSRGSRNNSEVVSARVREANKVATRAVTLYFESPDLVLVPEKRNVALPESDVAAVSTVVRELLAGSSNAAVARSFPKDAALRGAFLLSDGTAIIDLGGDTLATGWNTGSHEELMAVYSLVQTLMDNFPSVKRVRILVNGQPAPTLAGHVAIDHALKPLTWLVAAQPPAPAAPQPPQEGR